MLWATPPKASLVMIYIPFILMFPVFWLIVFFLSLSGSDMIWKMKQVLLLQHPPHTHTTVQSVFSAVIISPLLGLFAAKLHSYHDYNWWYFDLSFPLSKCSWPFIQKSQNLPTPHSMAKCHMMHQLQSAALNSASRGLSPCPDLDSRSSWYPLHHQPKIFLWPPWH